MGGCSTERPAVDVTRVAPREATATPDDDEATPAPVDGALAFDRVGGSADPVILAVGDSVLVLIADELAARLDGALTIDGTDCRRLDQGFTGSCGQVPAGTRVLGGIDAIAHDVADLGLRNISPTVGVVVLANNSSLAADDLDAAMAAFGPVEAVYWVNTRIDGFGRQDPNNRALDALAERNPRAIVVDWFAASADRDWRDDHVHPNAAGQIALADLIADAIACGCRP